MNGVTDPLRGIHLPAALEPVYVPCCDSALAEAARRATDGAPEGTLLWIGEATAVRGRLGSTWRSSPGGLHCALVLRPDLVPARFGEFLPLASVALGMAIAELVVPMTELRYRWPNAVWLGGGRVAASWLASGDGWLVLATSANVESAVLTDDFRYASVRLEGGNPDVTVAALLMGYARQLVRWLGRWDEEGVAPVLRRFRNRMEQLDTTLDLRLPDGSRSAGRAIALADDGAMVIERDGQSALVGINAYMGLPTG